MLRLRQVLSQLVPDECVLDGLSLQKRRRGFSITKTRSEEAVAIDLDKCRQWPDGRKRADGLFICLPQNADHFLVVLVELKGGHTEEAIDQLIDTSDILCKRPEPLFSAHAEPSRQFFRELRDAGHRGRVLGIVVSKGGLPREQHRSKMAKKHSKVKIKIHSTLKVVTDFVELSTWLGPAG